jgi:ribose transport system ATP-binding protein
MTLLELRDIHKRFGATQALGGVDLDVAPGEVHALIGENGAGKSTLMHILSGAFPPDRGTMRFAGERFAPAGPRQARRHGIVHIHQELSLCPHLTVAENILLGLEPARLGWIDCGRAWARARELLERFGGDSIAPGARLAALSIADRQVVEICRALASEARLVLMDEPTSSLSQPGMMRLFEVIRELRRQGIAMIYISHFLEEVRQVADRYTVLRDGASVRSGALDSITDPELIAAMVGRDMGQVFERHERPPVTGEPVLQVQRLASPPRLHEASFELSRGEVLGIAGLNGSGRTELVRALFGLAPATGHLRLHGKAMRLKHASPAARISAGVGYLSEDRKAEGLCLRLSVADNLTLTRLVPVARTGWIVPRRQEEAAKSVMARLNVRPPGTRTPVARLSGGNQQKVALGRLLHQDPHVLLLDEPTRGIDVGSKADIYSEIRRLAAAGKAILMVSSYLPELMGVCDRIAVMSRERLSSARPASDWSAEAILQAALAGDEPPGVSS